MNITIVISYIVAICSYRWYELMQFVPKDGEIIHNDKLYKAWLNFIYIDWQGNKFFLAKWTNYESNEYCKGLTPDINTQLVYA